jgi:putative restriction endonuclease
MLAETFKRSPSSFAAKLGNLDGRRAHGAKYEQLLWIHLTDNRYLYESLYETILQSGRLLGLNSQLLPDFLGFEDNVFRLVVDADSVSDAQLLECLQPDFAVLRETQDPADSRNTERALLGTARVGQQQFARKVLVNSEFACVFCGLSARSGNLPSSRMLVASHIKPWSQSDDRERVDYLNGLAACPTHDAAFESHLISVGADGTIMRSAELEKAIAADQSWHHNFGPLGLAEALLIPRTSVRPSAHYVRWHNSPSNWRPTSTLPLRGSS